MIVLEDGFDRERWEKTGMLPLNDVYESVFTITKVSSRILSACDSRRGLFYIDRQTVNRSHKFKGSQVNSLMLNEWL